MELHHKGSRRISEGTGHDLLPAITETDKAGTTQPTQEQTPGDQGKNNGAAPPFHQGSALPAIASAGESQTTYYQHQNVRPQYRVCTDH